MSKRGIIVNLSLFLVLIFWANSFAFIKIGVRELTFSNLALLRFLIVLPFLFFFKSLYKILKIEKKDLIKIIIFAALIVPSYHLFINKAETMISASVAALISGLNPIIIGILSAIFLKEDLTFKKILGFLISFSGVFLLTYGISGKFEINNYSGAILMICATSSWAVATVISKPLFKKYRPLDITIWGLFLGTLMLLPFLRPGLIQEVKSLSLIGWFSVLYLGFIAVLFGYIVWYKALEYKEASSIGAFVYLNPVLGTISSILILKERLTPLMIIGGAIIISGLLLINPLKMEKRGMTLEDEESE